MKLAMVGLGKMGFNICLNMMDKGHDVVAFDISKDSVDKAKEEGAIPAYTLEEVVSQLESPRVIWMMVPAGAPTDSVSGELYKHLEKGDILIDGGNSNYKETISRSKKFEEIGVSFIDVGTSGGMDGARHGICSMIGGNPEAFQVVEPIMKDISVENGYHYSGKSGSGHFLKMVHNGIEYGMMQAIGEGFDILEKSGFDYDYEQVARVWNNGSVIRSWLMELTEKAFSEDEKLEELRGIVQSSGEGKWTVETALDLQAAAPVIAMSVMMRYRSLENDTFSGKVVAALRNQFGGHSIEKAE